MKQYPINEIFYSLQGEGHYSGRAAIFVRFSGCNLQCPFCDTAHQKSVLMTLENIIALVSEYPRGAMVVLTGGEPSLYADNDLIDALHACGRYIAIETNGTNPLPEGINWVTLSPKAGMAPGGDKIRLTGADEIKVVNVGQPLAPYFDMPQRKEATLMYLQPCFVEDREERMRNITDTIEKVKSDPRWQLSAQLHRYLSIP